LLVACSSSPQAVTPKKPNNTLIVGDYERRPPDGTMAIRFTANGELRVAKDKTKLDAEPTEATGAWVVDGDKLTLTYLRGMCADGPKVGVYKVVISKIGIRFTKIDDSCERRAKMDGQTWWRIR
jgi:hypothetical protein